jgi:hypothetical protein
VRGAGANSPVKKQPKRRKKNRQLAEQKLAKTPNEV